MLVGLAIVVLVPLVVVAPHTLPLHRATPAGAAAVWLLALGLRGMIAVSAAVFLFLYLPSAGLVHVATHWCLHALLPFLAEHLGMRGHSVADLASLLPASTLAASVVWAAFGLGRAAVRLELFLRRRSRGSGPLGSTIIDEDAVLVAVPGVGRGKIVVSRAALVAFDGDELAASVAHERGHLLRGHRPLLVVARILATLGRAIPGTRTAERELGLSLERDADEYAVRQTHDPLALASAICKSAASARTAVPAVIGLRGESNLSVRLDYLMSGGRQRAAAAMDRTMRMLAAALAAAVLVLSVAAPVLAFGAAPHVSSAHHLVDGCVD